MSWSSVVYMVCVLIEILLETGQGKKKENSGEENMATLLCVAGFFGNNLFALKACMRFNMYCALGLQHSSSATRADIMEGVLEGVDLQRLRIVRRLGGGGEDSPKWHPTMLRRTFQLYY